MITTLAVPASGPGSVTQLPINGSVDQTHISHDGHWVAYNSRESGQWEVYVASVPSFSGKQQVSVAGGVQPNWRQDGRELFFMTPAGQS